MIIMVRALFGAALLYFANAPGGEVLAAERVNAQDFEQFETSLRKMSQTETFAAFTQLGRDFAILQFEKQNYPLPDAPPIATINRLEEQLARIERGDGPAQLTNAFRSEQVAQGDRTFLRDIFIDFGKVLTGKSQPEVHKLAQDRLSGLKTAIETKKRQIQLRAEQPTNENSNPRATLQCNLPKLDNDTSLQVIGVYEGKNPSALEFSNVDDETNQIDVLIPKLTQKTFLVATSYSAVVWNFAIADQKKLSGIFIMGYESQAVANVPSGIKVFFLTRDGGETGCGRAVYAYEGGRQLAALDSLLNRAFGKSLDKFQGGYGGSSFTVGLAPGELPPANFQPKPVALESTYSLRPLQIVDLPPGKLGLAKLEREGVIRRATKADIDAWIEKASAPYQKLTPGYRVQLAAIHHETYVVLKETKLPRGLYGANSASFLVPAEVPRPQLPNSHAGIYFMKDGTCNSPSPECRRIAEVP